MQTLLSRRHEPWKLLLLALGLSLMLGIVSCGHAGDPNPREVAPTQTVLVSTATPEATQTPPRGKVLYLRPGGVIPRYEQNVRSTLERLAAQAELELVEQDSVPADAGLQAYRVVLLFSPEQAVFDEVQAGTSAPIVVIGSQPDNTGDAWVIDDYLASQEQAAFLAGYIAALLTQDWRIGVLSGSSEPDLRTAFVQGGQYFCGLCRPEFPPYFAYPVSIPFDPSSPQGLSIGLAEAAEKTLKLIMLDEISAEKIAETAPDQPYQFLGLAGPPEKLRSVWVATLRPAPELALEEYWAMILQGAPGEQIHTPIGIEDVDPSLLTQGKLRLVEEIRDDLVAGYIQPVGLVE